MEQLEKRCYASAIRSVKWLIEEGYDANLDVNMYNSVVGFSVNANTIEGTIKLHFRLDEKCHYDRCEVEIGANVILPVDIDEEDYAIECVNGIADALMRKNTTQYSIFPPRYVGFKILLVLGDSDISEREYKVMTDSGRWKKANQDFIMKK